MDASNYLIPSVFCYVICLAATQRVKIQLTVTVSLRWASFQFQFIKILGVQMTSISKFHLLFAVHPSLLPNLIANANSMYLVRAVIFFFFFFAFFTLCWLLQTKVFCKILFTNWLQICSILCLTSLYHALSRV